MKPLFSDVHSFAAFAAHCLANKVACPGCDAPVGEQCRWMFMEHIERRHLPHESRLELARLTMSMARDWTVCVCKKHGRIFAKWAGCSLCKLEKLPDTSKQDESVHNG